MVDKKITLTHLHQIIQTVMGWYNCHLWTFELGDESFGPVDKSGMAGFTPDEMNDAAKQKIGTLAGFEKAKFRYTYDMGDGWEHQILVEKMLPRTPGQCYPLCIAGKMNCPPEDCGGIWGYYALQEALKDPKHPEHEDMTEWVGGDFDPVEFDVDAVNQRLRAEN